MSVILSALSAAALLAGSFSLQAQGAEAPNAGPDTSCYRTDSCPIQTFYLANAVKGDEPNDIVTALRNMLRNKDRIYLVQSQNAIVIAAPADQIEAARKLLTDLDRPKKTYRLTYTVAETDAGKLVSTQHYSMIVVSGQETSLKEGSKVPVLTGSYSPQGAPPGTGVETQFTYLDVGMNFSATLEDFASGVRLRSLVEQSSISEEKSGLSIQDPIVRQSVLKGTSFLTPGKPLLLGSLDIPNTTRHLDIDVVMDLVHGS